MCAIQDNKNLLALQCFGIKEFLINETLFNLIKNENDRAVIQIFALEYCKNFSTRSDLFSVLSKKILAFDDVDHSDFLILCGKQIIAKYYKIKLEERGVSFSVTTQDYAEMMFAETANITAIKSTFYCPHAIPITDINCFVDIIYSLVKERVSANLISFFVSSLCLNVDNNCGEVKYGHISFCRERVEGSLIWLSKLFKTHECAQYQSIIIKLYDCWRNNFVQGE